MESVEAAVQSDKVVLRLTVKNHPGVMSHICGLFSRRAFNVDALVCLPHADARQSSIWLLVSRDTRLDQMMRQLEKLEDVAQVVPESNPELFDRLADFMHRGGLF